MADLQDLADALSRLNLDPITVERLVDRLTDLITKTGTLDRSLDDLGRTAGRTRDSLEDALGKRRADRLRFTTGVVKGLKDELNRLEQIARADKNLQGQDFNKGYEERLKLLRQISAIEKKTARERGHQQADEYHRNKVRQKESLREIVSRDFDPRRAVREFSSGAKSIRMLAARQLSSFTARMPIGGFLGLLLYGAVSSIIQEQRFAVAVNRIRARLGPMGAGFGGGGARSAMRGMAAIGLGQDAGMQAMESTASGFAGAGVAPTGAGFGATSFLGSGILPETYALARSQGMEGSQLAGLMGQTAIALGGTSGSTVERVGGAFLALAKGLEKTNMGFPQFIQGLSQVASAMRFYTPDIETLAGSFLSLQRRVYGSLGLSGSAGRQVAQQIAIGGMQAAAGLLGSGGGNPGLQLLMLQRMAQRRAGALGDAAPEGLQNMAGGDLFSLRGATGALGRSMFGGQFGRLAAQTLGDMIGVDFANIKGNSELLSARGRLGLMLPGADADGIVQALQAIARSPAGSKTAKDAEARLLRKFDEIGDPIGRVKSIIEGQADPIKRFVQALFQAFISTIGSMLAGIIAAIYTVASFFKPSLKPYAQSYTRLAGDLVNQAGTSLKSVGGIASDFLFDPFSTSPAQMDEEDKLIQAYKMGNRQGDKALNRLLKEKGFDVQSRQKAVEFVNRPEDLARFERLSKTSTKRNSRGDFVLTLTLKTESEP